MRDGRIQEPIELRLEQRQVAILASAALILLGVVFALGVLVGRQLASATLGAPQQPAPGDLAALDAAQRSPPPSPRIAPPEPKAAEMPPAAPKAQPALPRLEPAGAATSATPVPATSGAPAVARSAAVAASQAAPTAPPAPAARDAETPPTADEALEDDDAPAPPPLGATAPGPAPAPPSRSGPKAPGAFTVQLGASPDRKVAGRIEARARAAGFDPYVVAVDLGSKGTWYRVRAGAFASKEEAAKLQKEAGRQLRVPAVVMPAK